MLNEANAVCIPATRNKETPYQIASKSSRNTGMTIPSNHCSLYLHLARQAIHIVHGAGVGEGDVQTNQG